VFSFVFVNLVDIFKAIKPFYATFIDFVDPIQMVDLLADYLTSQDMVSLISRLRSMSSAK